MASIQHVNFGWLHAPPFPPACCHCLLIRDESRVVLVDTGIGMLDIQEPLKRIGKEAIDAAGFQFRPQSTALHQLQQMGFDAASVSDIVLTHGDPDHVGGLADFPEATVHISIEEKLQIEKMGPRYSQSQFAHRPKWATYAVNDSQFLGMPSRRVTTAANVAIHLVPLPGHTLGHCGVGVRCNERNWLHVGDAYYLRAELLGEPHPVDGLATARADDDDVRRASLKILQALAKRNGSVEMFGYHDVSELPTDIPGFDED